MTRGVLLQEYERWIAARDPEGDIRPLRNAALAHLRSQPALSEIAPCLAVLYFSVAEFDDDSRLRKWLGRSFVYAWCWILEHVVYHKRPMWNDFRMALWQLSRDPRYVRELQRHLDHARHRGYEEQIFSGAWMVRSVCQQDPEFKEIWTQIQV